MMTEFVLMITCKGKTRPSDVQMDSIAIDIEDRLGVEVTDVDWEDQ